LKKRTAFERRLVIGVAGLWCVGAQHL
jgi:hypothetical protein